MGKDNQLDLLLRKARRLRVGDCDADLALNEVHGPGGRVVRLTPKAAGVLEVLLYTAGQPVSKERLLAEVWRGEFPTEDVVTHAIGELRRAFGDDTRAPRYIRTLARVGYALIAEVGPLLEPPSSAPAPAASAPGPEATLQPPGDAGRATPPGASRRRRWLAATAVLAAAAAAVAVAWMRPGPRPAADPAVAAVAAEAEATRAQPITSMPGSEMFPALSPDGSLLAFSALDPSQPGVGPRVFLQVPDSDNPRRLSQAEADSEFYPVFSPDGSELLLQRVKGGSCRFVVASVLGGAEREVGACSPQLVTHVAWTPDGQGLVLPRLNGAVPPLAVLHHLDLASGELRPLDYPTSSEDSDVQARFSPDGRLIALRRGPMPHSDLFVMNADGSGLRQLTALRAQMPGFDWLPDGSALVFASDHTGSLALHRVALADQRIAPLGVEGAWWPDVAPLRDDLVFVREASALEVAELVLDGNVDSAPTRVAASSRSNGSPRYAPDGSRLALVSERSGQSTLQLVEGDSVRRLAEHGEGTIAEPRWSADGRELLYVLRGGGARLHVVEVETGRRRDATPEGHTVLSAAFSPDGRAIVFTSDFSGRWELWWQDREGGPPRQLTHGGARHPEFRDADRLVYVAGAEIGSLHQLELSSGTVQDLALDVAFWNQRAWHLADDGIYALRGIGETGIYRRPWAGGEWQLVEPLGELRLGENRISLDLARGRALVTASPDQQQGDIHRLRGLAQWTGAAQ